VVLRIHHLLLAMRLRIDIFQPGERESGYDDWEAHLEEVLRHCEFLVQREQETKGPWSQRSCSSGLGYVSALHTVAARCRNPRLRWRAVELLLACSRCEGLWDARLAGKVVSQAIQIEEQATKSLGDHAKVSADRRVREVKFEPQGEKSAALRFITVDDWKQGRRGTERLIEL
jgi:hypothetical protein